MPKYLDLVGEVVVRVVAQPLGITSIDEAVQHERVHRKERAVFDDMTIDIGIAISDPALAIPADAREAVIIAAAPDGIRVEQPEWRRVCSCCEVDIDVRPLPAQFADQMDRRVEVAVELAALDYFVGISRAVELELVHAVLVDHLEAGVAEVAIVFRSGEREATFVGFESLRPSRSEALLLWSVIATPGREPDAGRGAEFGRCLRHLRQPIRKSWIEVPQRRRIVPAIVEQEAVEFHAALLRKLLAESVDDRESTLFVVAVEVTQVVPRVVVQERSIGMRAFEFQVGTKVTAELASVRDSKHSRIGDALL